jgi:hypothetical protein
MRKAITEKIITSILLISVIVSILRYKVFDITFLFGTISVITITVLLIRKKNDLSLAILFFSLILSTFNIFIFNTVYAFYINGFNAFPLLLLFILIFSRWKELLDLKYKWSSVEPIEITKSYENKIAIFKREFQNLSSEELIMRHKNYKLVEEAKIAIDLILKERDVKNKFTV